MKKFELVRKTILIQFIFFLGIFRAVILWPIRGANCPSEWLTPSGPCNFYSAILEMVLWLIPLFLMILEINWNRSFRRFIQACRSNWLVIAFFLLAVFSLIWSINPLISAYKVFILILCSLLAVYIGFAYRLNEIIRNISVFLAAVILFSLYMSIFQPGLGIMADSFYKGAWSGIFWHRNYLGCFMALAIALFLYQLPSNFRKKSLVGYGNILFLISAAYLLVRSKSATGIITALILVSLVIVLFFWEKWHHKLSRVHYLGIMGVISVAGLIIITNLEFLFGLLGRSTSLTGRIPMWEYLFQNLVIHRPWLGFGYGAIWHYQGIRETLALTLNWGSAVMIGDNGFIDILLHLGIAGSIMLVILIAKGFFHGFKYLLKIRTLDSGFPLLVLIFGLVVNISLSFILESESFLWIIAIALIVSIKDLGSKSGNILIEQTTASFPIN